MAADASVALSDIRPVDVFSHVEEDANGALVSAFGQDDLIAFAKRRMGRFELRLDESNAGHLAPLRAEPGLIHESRFLKLGSHCFLFTGLAGGVPLRRLLNVEPLRFLDRSSSL